MLQIWNRDNLDCVQILTGHTGSVLCLQYDENIIRDTGPVPESEQTSYNPSAVNSDDEEPVSSPVKTNVDEDGRPPVADVEKTPVKTEANVDKSREESPKAQETVKDNASVEVKEESVSEKKVVSSMEKAEAEDKVIIPEEKTAENVAHEKNNGDKSQVDDKGVEKVESKDISKAAIKATPEPTQPDAITAEKVGTNSKSDDDPKVEEKASSPTKEPSSEIPAIVDTDQKEAPNGELTPAVTEKPKDKLVNETGPSVAITKEREDPKVDENTYVPPSSALPAKDIQKKEAQSGELLPSKEERPKDKPSPVKSHFSIASLVSRATTTRRRQTPLTTR